MKINKKLLIPVFATAMGLSVLGGISGAVAWYQFNTKVSASYMGVTTADGGVLAISTDQANWKKDINFGSEESKLHPVTFGGLLDDGQLPTVARKHPEAGVTNPEEWDAAIKNTDYHQFSLFVKAEKLVDGAYVREAVNVKLDDLVLEAVTEDKTVVSDALRVHLDIMSGSTRTIYLLSPNAISGEECPLFGPLDLDPTPGDDLKGGYAWEDNHDQVLNYGYDGKYQVTQSLESLENTTLFTTNATSDVKIVVTIWLEGFHKLGTGNAASSNWDPSRDAGSSVHFGLKLSTARESFIND